MLITKDKFNQYQGIFYSKVTNTPYFVELIRVSIVDGHYDEDGGFNLEAFVGSSNRVYKSYRLQCLYEKQIADRTRDKYGIPKEVNGVVYLSPRQLVPLFGDYHIDVNKTKFKFEGHTQVINKVVYLEELYGSCVGLQIFLQDELNA